jgi:hypothetical protein
MNVTFTVFGMKKRDFLTQSDDDIFLIFQRGKIPAVILSGWNRIFSKTSA